MLAGRSLAGSSPPAPGNPGLLTRSQPSGKGPLTIREARLRVLRHLLADS
jgi:hypothetical protein